MNRILSAFAAACVVLSACETISPLEEQEVSAVVTNPSSSTSGSLQKDSVVFTADLGAQTKTYLEYDSSKGVYKLLWSESEQIIVWDYNTLSDEYSAKYEFCDMFSGAGTSTAQFIGSIEADRYVAIYANNYYFPIGGKPNIGLDTYQNYYAESISSYYPMIAVSDTRNFQFQNLCSILKVKVKGNGESLSQIKVTSKAGEPLSGYATVEFENDEPVLNFEEVYADVTLNCSSLTLSNEAQECYIVIPAQVYADGLELVFVTEDGQYMTVSTAKNIETKRSQMHEIAVSFEEDSLPDGMYVVGTAVGYPVPRLEAANRSGRYERFVSIEKNTPFTIVKWENGVKTEYDIPEQELCTAPGAPGIDYDWGRLSEGQSYGGMTVRKDGLYIVVVDMNEYGDLYAPQISAVPVDWKLRGSCNGWATTEMSMTYMSPTSINFVAEDVIFATSNAEYKFDFSYDWFISSLDYYNQSPEYSLITNLGVLESGALGYSGSNIPLGGSGVYDVMISWSMSDGLVSNEFSYSYERKGEAPVQDYSACRLELVGASVADGSPDESSWLWDNVLCADNDGYPEVSGTTYRWTWSTWLYDEDDCYKYATKTPGFKIRTLNYQYSGGIAAFDLGYSNVDTYNSDYVYALDIYNIMVGESGNYDVTLTLDALTGEFTITVVMTGNTRFSGSNESL